jgi:hypothetical protein
LAVGEANETVQAEIDVSGEEGRCTGESAGGAVGGESHAERFSSCRRECVFPMARPGSSATAGQQCCDIVKNRSRWTGKKNDRLGRGVGYPGAEGDIAQAGGIRAEGDGHTRQRRYGLHPQYGTKERRRGVPETKHGTQAGHGGNKTSKEQTWAEAQVTPKSPAANKCRPDAL